MKIRVCIGLSRCRIVETDRLFSFVAAGNRCQENRLMMNAEPQERWREFDKF